MSLIAGGDLDRLYRIDEAVQAIAARPCQPKHLIGHPDTRDCPAQTEFSPRSFTRADWCGPCTCAALLAEANVRPEDRPEEDAA